MAMKEYLLTEFEWTHCVVDQLSVSLSMVEVVD